MTVPQVPIVPVSATSAVATAPTPRSASSAVPKAGKALPCAGIRANFTACANTTRNIDRWCRECRWAPWETPTAQTAAELAAGAISPTVLAARDALAGGAPLDPDTIRVTTHAQQRFVLRWGGTRADAEALIRSQLGALAGQVAPLIRDIDEDGKPRSARHYPVGPVVFLTDKTNQVLITVLNSPHAPLAATDVIPGLDPRTTGISRTARDAFARLTNTDPNLAEAALRDTLTGLKGRVSEVVGNGERRHRAYTIDGLVLLVTADNTKVITVAAARAPKPAQGKRPAGPPAALGAGDYQRLLEAPPRVSKAALTRAVAAHPDLAEAGLCEAAVAEAVRTAAGAGKLKPAKTGYRGYCGAATVFVSADLGTVTGYALMTPGAEDPLARRARKDAATADAALARPGAMRAAQVEDATDPTTTASAAVAAEGSGKSDKSGAVAWLLRRR